MSTGTIFRSLLSFPLIFSIAKVNHLEVEQLATWPNSSWLAPGFCYNSKALVAKSDLECLNRAGNYNPMKSRELMDLVGC